MSKQFEVALKATGTIIVEAETAAEAAEIAMDRITSSELDEWEVEWTEEIEEDDD